MTARSLTSPPWSPWLLGALGLVPVELVALGSGRPAVMWTAATLLLCLGLLCGLVIAGSAWLAARLARGPLSAAGIQALPAAVPLALVAQGLFDGGLASSLPGAAWGHVWVPLAGTAALTLGLWRARLLLDRPRARTAVLVALLAAVTGVEYANRTLYPGGYDDIHAFLTLLAVAGAGAALRLALAAPAARAPHRRLDRPAMIMGLAAITVATSFVLVLDFGLRDAADRLVVATRGMHTRQLARVVRQAMDRDRDGHAAVLGGGDCDDSDPTRHPDAFDIPGNGVDEDCDGEDAAPLPARSTGDLDQVRAAWRATPDVRAALERTGEFHLVLVLVDALRADVLADESRDAYPHLHALAAESRHFRRAFATASGTDMAIATLLTGRIDPFGPVDITLLESLAAAGLDTHAVLPREVLRWAGKTLIQRGLHHHERVITDPEQRDVGSHTTGHQTTARGLAAFDRAQDQRLFLWLHYFDVHEHHQIELSDRRLRAALDGQARPDRADRYRAAARLVDQEIGRLVQELKERGLWDRTMLVLLSDHGESLGEDPRLGDTHGRYLYNSLIHVPLLVRVPGIAPAVVDAPVSLLDVPPTLLDLTGARPLDRMNGHSLLPHLLDGAPAALRAQHAPIVLNESDQHGIIDWPYKLLVRPADNLLELYDLEADFGEERDLMSREPARARMLHNLYKGYPRVVIDRSRAGREKREALARPAPRN